MFAQTRTARELITCFRGQNQLTRSEIQVRTGLSRVTVSQGVQDLISKKVLTEIDGELSQGGRKASTLSLNENAGYIGIAYFSATSISIAVANLKGQIVKEERTPVYISEGPDSILPSAISTLVEMLNTFPKSKRLGIVVGVPGPVSHGLGKVVSPPIMRGWDKINFQKEFGEATGLPVFLENDTNLLVLAEHRLVYPETDNLILIKIATGIGGGLIINGELLRGSSGSAGDIGHVQLDALKGTQCRCGHTDCVESFSSGWALTEKIISMGYDVSDTSDIAALCRNGDTQILHLIKEASSYIGHAVADAVSLLNPSKVIVVGRLVDATDIVLATIKEVVYQRSGALATKNLEILPSKLGDDMALLGSAQLGLDRFFFES
jgi:predicted NBD/HSP70 family sugar kinase